MSLKLIEDNGTYSSIRFQGACSVCGWHWPTGVGYARFETVELGFREHDCQPNPFSPDPFYVNSPERSWIEDDQAESYQDDES